MNKIERQNPSVKLGTAVVDNNLIEGKQDVVAEHTYRCA